MVKIGQFVFLGGKNMELFVVLFLKNKHDKEKEFATSQI